MIRMKKWIACLLLIFIGSGFVYGQSRHVRHGLPCRECEWMVRTIRLSDRRADSYYKIIHTYAKKIEKEARKGGKDWRKAERKINQYRTERDRKVRSILTPQQFRVYARFIKERPSRIHDRSRWFKPVPDHRRRYNGVNVHGTVSISLPSRSI